MIKGLMGGNGITVIGGNTTVPYINQNNQNPIQGMIRIWGTDMQVYDGNNWLNLGISYATAELNGDVQSVIQWAREERDRQSKREQLVKKNPALQKALEAINRAQANFDLLEKFVEHDTDITSDAVMSPPMTSSP